MQKYLSLVKFSHTIFALPFAMIGFFLAISLTDHEFTITTFVLVIVCMVTARNAAMAFNRYIDKEIDKENPRTQTREIPNGILSEKSVLLFVIANSVIFIFATYFINDLCFYLSPVALLIVLGYSFTKRFTSICHFILGLGLSLAPVGAFIAVTAQFDLIPVLYGIAVFFWVAGFDIIYSLQDEDYDIKANLFSIPQRIGRKNALSFAVFCHIISSGTLIWAAYVLHTNFSGIGYLHIAGLLIFISLLFYQHTLVSTKDISKINLAFFTTNGIASLVFSIAVILDLFY